MAFPLTVPQAGHSVTTKVIGGPNVPHNVQITYPSTRLWHKPTFPLHSRTAPQTRAVTVPFLPKLAQLNNPNREWAPLLIFEGFTTMSYGQWLVRAARDRP